MSVYDEVQARKKMGTSLELIPFHYLALVSLLSFIIVFYKWRYNTTVNTLPSPRKLPIIGNLHQLGMLPHRSLHSLSNRLGDLMLLYLGTKPTLVVSSSNGAEEIMKTHDVIFANRPFNRVACLVLYNAKDMAFSKYGEYWRMLKSICTINMLSSRKVRSFRRIREEEVAQMVERIKVLTPDTQFNVPEGLIKLTTDVMSRVAFGRKYTTNVGELMSELSEVLGAFNIGDFVPWLSWIDELSGVLPRARNIARALDSFIQDRVDEHINQEEEEDDNGDEIQDFVDILLKIQRDDPSFQLFTLKALILNMIGGGIETTATLLEWTMSELLLHPRVMKQLQEEVRGFSKGKTMVEEDDLKDMIYLKAVIKEALRLHPLLPLLFFREPSQDVKVNGYDISAGTQVIINAWAIHRHPAYWEEPEKFRPERFLSSSVEINSLDFEFLAFGAGRRGCPGMSFALIIAELALANLVAEFNWKLPSEVLPDSFLEETFGTSVRKRYPLLAIPTPYSSN